jgi:flagellar hook assembly protein FlgD
VEFRVFSLTGEEVYSRNLPQGSEAAALGENEISWDGRNSSGHAVMSGVYIVSVKIVRTGEYARLKVAVVK